jgi:hypothetical protein
MKQNTSVSRDVVTLGALEATPKPGALQEAGMALVVRVAWLVVVPMLGVMSGWIGGMVVNYFFPPMAGIIHQIIPPTVNLSLAEIGAGLGFLSVYLGRPVRPAEVKVVTTA